MKYPNKLMKNDTIGVTATSMGIVKKGDIKRFEQAKNNLEKMNYKVKNTSNVFTNSKFVSSSGVVRAKEFLNLWCDKNIKVISQVRGGELLLEMLPYLDDNLINNSNPKWIFGYSDSSLLNFYITTKFDIATINSTNFLDFKMPSFHKSLISIFDCFNEDVIIQKSFSKYQKVKKNTLNYNLDSNVKYKHLYNLKNDVIKGRVIGGCLEAITEILGTNFDYVYEFTKKYNEGILWYLDIYNSNPLDLYRILLRMKWANWFNNINGIIIGRTKSLKKIKDLTYKDVLHKVFDSMNISVIYDVDIGHIKPQFSVINGSLGTFTYNNGKGIFKQEKK